MLTTTFSFISFVFGSFIAPAISSPLPSHESGLRFFLTFGDSYSQTEFNISDTKPSPSNVFGNPPFPGVTTDNGANWLEYIVQDFAPEITLSYAFGFSGATVDATIVPGFIPTVLSLVNQTQEFIQNLATTPKPSYAPWTSENSAFAFWFGVNDVQNSVNFPGDKMVLHEEILDSYVRELSVLHGAGARLFVVLSAPPIQKTPQVLAEGQGNVTATAQQIANFNRVLNTRINAFKTTIPDSKVFIYDTTNDFNRVINDPVAFGLNPNSTCSNEDGVSCVWWNPFHPGQVIQKLVGEGVFGILKEDGFF